MTDVNQNNTPMETASSDKTSYSSRFERFTDAELSMLSEALRELLQVKTEAMNILNADLGSNPKDPFTEADFGIPEIESLMSELEALL